MKCGDGRQALCGTQPSELSGKTRGKRPPAEYVPCPEVWHPELTRVAICKGQEEGATRLPLHTLAWAPPRACSLDETHMGSWVEAEGDSPGDGATQNLPVQCSSCLGTVLRGSHVLNESQCPSALSTFSVCSRQVPDIPRTTLACLGISVPLDPNHHPTEKKAIWVFSVESLKDAKFKVYSLL